MPESGKPLGGNTGNYKIIIAQRISSVQHADHILVIEDGHINGYGTHDQLVEGQ